MRKGYSNRQSIPPELLTSLERGDESTATLAEGLAIRFTVLFANVTSVPESAIAIDDNAGVTIRMQQAGRALLAIAGYDGLAAYTNHTSDTVRGWAAYAFCALPDLGIQQRLSLLNSAIIDPHFAVREWAWLALRPHIAAALPEALTTLTPLAKDTHAYRRRFASESTRPRGVWCSHLLPLKEAPWQAMSLLEPLVTDDSRYVIESLANWMNDAATVQPEWVKQQCLRWQQEYPQAPQLSYLLKRAQRRIA